MKKDYKLGALAGFLTGLCLIPTAWNIGSIHGISLQSMPLMVALPFVCMVGILFGIAIGKALAKVLPIVYQFAKFAAIGFLNTAINFAVLNLLSLATGVAAGLSVGEYNIPATAIAAANSYFWNKYWVFGGVSRGSMSDPFKFIVVTIIGLLVRSGVLIGMTNLAHGSIADALWLNVSNVAATIVGIMVDFLGYKFIVFVRRNK